MVTCRCNTSTALDLMCEAVNAATGWDLDVKEAMAVGRRAVNLARAFNLRHGIGAELDAPSPRDGSTLKTAPMPARVLFLTWRKCFRIITIIWAGMSEAVSRFLIL